MSDSNIPGLGNIDVPGNAYLQLLLAMTSTSERIMKQQFVDSSAAVAYGNLEESLNNFWYSSTSQVSNSAPIGNIQYNIDGLEKVINAGGDNEQYLVAEWNASLQHSQSVAQQSINKADSTMQLANTQVNNDSTNIQSVNQLASMMNIMGFIANLLAKG